MEIKKILFPTDFTEGALAALPHAVDLAKFYKAKLCLLHVIYDMSMSTGLNIPHVSFDAYTTKWRKAPERSSKILVVSSGKDSMMLNAVLSGVSL